MTRWINGAGLLLVTLLGLAACAPQVGSDAWCKKMDQTPKADWTMSDAGDYAKHCVLNQKPD